MTRRPDAIDIAAFALLFQPWYTEHYSYASFFPAAAPDAKTNNMATKQMMVALAFMMGPSFFLLI